MPKVPEAVRPPAAPRPPWADVGHWRRMREMVAVTSACWIFTGAVSDDGYGRFWVPSRGGSNRDGVVRPSRWMWQAHHGPIPGGLVVRHRCDRSLCVRPACLLLGEPADNVRDALSRDRLTNMKRTGKADRRGARAAALALRSAVLEAVHSGTSSADALADVVTRVQAAGDPYANQPELFTNTGPTTSVTPVQERLF